MEPENGLNSEKALHFRDRFREARLVALRDAEAFHEILYTLERFGYLLRGKEGDISKYKEVVRAEAENSALAVDIPGKHRE